MFSARLSSRNCSPDFVFSKDSFHFCTSTLFSDVLTRDCCCRRCCRFCFSRRPGFTRIVKATVPRCTLEDSSSFQRCPNLVSLAFHGGLWMFATQIIRVFFLFAQWWTVIHNPQLLRIHVGHSGIFNDGTCSGGWFWIHSRNFSLMTTVNHFANDCPTLNFHNFHTWDCSREHSPGFTRTFGGGGCCSKVDFPYLLFLCAFSMTSFHSFSIVAFSSGINTVWDERSFVRASRFHRACVSERHISRVFWTIRNSRFLEVRWKEPHSEFTSLSSQDHTWEYLILPGISVLLEEFVSQIRCAARRDIMCLLSPSEKLSEELSWDLFIGENYFVKLYWSTEFRPSLQYQYNWICFCLRCFGFSPILSPHRIFLVGGVSTKNVNFGNKEWCFSRHVSWTLGSIWWQ